MIISLDAENKFDKIKHPFMIKTLSTEEIAGSLLNPIKFFSSHWFCRRDIWSIPFMKIKINMFFHILLKVQTCKSKKVNNRIRKEMERKIKIYYIIIYI